MSFIFTVLIISNILSNTILVKLFIDKFTLDNDLNYDNCKKMYVQ